uniref:CvpA family protein n=1 Tax=candidate division WOR-3 bacterium TaxID=2052148 RepID=A0A7C2P3K5_UNCW3
MNGVDVIVLIVLAFFVLRGLLVGLIKEILSLVGLILAIFISLKFSDLMGFYLKGIKDPLILKVLSILILFALVIFLTQLVIFLIRKAIKPTFIGLLDRFFGLLLGFLEGVVVAGTLLYFAGRFEFARVYIEQSAYSGTISKIYETVVIKNFREVREFFESMKD